jgi:hypothetical protein
MCAIEIASELPLVELDRGRDEIATDCLVRLDDRWPVEIAQWLETHEHRDGFLAKEHPDGRLVVHLDGAAIIVVNAGNDTIVVHPERRDDDVLSHLVVDHVLPRVLARRGFTVLHATCIAYGDRAVAFVGASGAGKSTLAMSGLRHGATLLADDCLVLAERDGGFDVLASYGGSRLWSDSAAALAIDGAATSVNAMGKARLRIDDGLATGTRARLVALFVLERGAPDVHVAVMPPAEAFWRLGQNSYVYDGVRHGFDTVGDLVDTTAICRLQYPSSFASLPAVHAAINQSIDL